MRALRTLCAAIRCVNKHANAHMATVAVEMEGGLGILWREGSFRLYVNFRARLGILSAEILPQNSDVEILLEGGRGYNNACGNSKCESGKKWVLVVGV